jgi:hypothetical protein
MLGAMLKTGAAAAAVLALAACGGEDTPVVKASTTVPPGTGTSAAGDQPVAGAGTGVAGPSGGAAGTGTAGAPAPAATPDIASAVAFVNTYAATYNAAHIDGDTRPLMAIVAPTCKFCRNTVRDIESAAGVGTVTKGGDVHVIKAVPKKLAKGRARLLVTLSQDPGTRTSASGEAEPNPGFSSFQAAYTLNWVQDHWVVGEIVNDITSMVPRPG